MNITAYIKREKIPARDLALRLGVTPSCVSMIINGHRRPSPELALRIQEATNGEVTVMELLYPGLPLPRLNKGDDCLSPA